MVVMPWEITPYVGVGPVRFGMTRQQVRDAVGAPSEEFKRTPSSRISDKFTTLGAFAYYTDDGGLEAIEFTRLQTIFVEKLDLTTTPTDQLLRAVLLLDPDAEIEPKSAGFISRRLGAGIWTEGDRDHPPQSVIAFAQGYYD